MTRTLLIILLLLGSAIGAVAHPGSGIVVDRRGCVYFVDTGGGVWRIEPGGRLVRHDGHAIHWLAIDERGRFSHGRLPAFRSAEINAIGADPTLILSSDFPVTIGRDGSLYYPELGPDQRLRIIRFTASGSRSVRATLPSRAGGGALRWLNGLATGPDGSLYYTEDKTVRKVDERGAVSTLATNVTVSDCVLIPGIEPGEQPYLRGLAVAADGTLFVAAAGCGAVVKITPRGKVIPILRTVAPWSPTAVAVSSSGVYVLEYLHTAEENRRAWLPRVRKISADGTVATIATVERQ